MEKEKQTLIKGFQENSVARDAEIVRDIGKKMYPIPGRYERILEDKIIARNSTSSREYERVRDSVILSIISTIREAEIELCPMHNSGPLA